MCRLAVVESNYTVASAQGRGPMSAPSGYCCKSRKSNDPENLAKVDFLDAATAAKPSMADTKTGGRFCVK